MRHINKRKNKVTFQDIAIIGWKFHLNFHLPPFDGNADECFFDIDEFKETEQFQEFIGMINDLKIPYEYAYCHAKKDGKIYLTIKTKYMETFEEGYVQNNFDLI